MQTDDNQKTQKKRRPRRYGYLAEPITLSNGLTGLMLPSGLCVYVRDVHGSLRRVEINRRPTDNVEREISYGP